MHNMLGEIDVTYNGRMELSDYIQVMLSQIQKRIIAGKIIVLHRTSTL